jgi:hypothetical protein
MKQRNDTDRRSGKDRRIFDDNILHPDKRGGIDRRKKKEQQK